MKTSEFIKYFEDEGLIVEAQTYCVRGFKILKDDYTPLFDVTEDNTVDTDYTAFIDDLSFTKQQEYYKVIFDYLMTPIEERKDEKKYYLIMKHDPYSVIQYGEKNNFRVVATSYTKQRLHKYIFTEDEIKDIPDYFKHPAVWEQVEVECGE